MEVKAKVNNLRMSPRKVRLVIDVVRGMKIAEAIDQLTFMNKKASKPVQKGVESALANAVNNFELEKDNLFVKEIRVDEGRTLKRWMPRARGRATPLRKRSSHVIITLGELVDSGKKEGKKQEIEAPIKIDTKSLEGDKKETKDKNIDSKVDGKAKHTKVDGKGAVSKMFRRKSGNS